MDVHQIGMVYQQILQWAELVAARAGVASPTPNPAGPMAYPRDGSGRGRPLSPLFSSHINFCGWFRIDMGTRIDLTWPHGLSGTKSDGRKT